MATEYLRRLLMALAGRPDVTRLFGPHEKALYEEARQLVNRAALNLPTPCQVQDDLIIRLRRTMEHKGLATRDVAAKAGLGFSTVARALRGEGVLPRTRGKLSRWVRRNELRDKGGER